MLRGLLQKWTRQLIARFETPITDALERGGYLEGLRSCAGCHEIIDDDFEHDCCVTPPDRFEDVAFSLVPDFAVTEHTRTLRNWRA